MQVIVTAAPLDTCEDELPELPLASTLSQLRTCLSVTWALFDAIHVTFLLYLRSAGLILNSDQLPTKLSPPSSAPSSTISTELSLDPLILCKVSAYFQVMSALGNASITTHFTTASLPSSTLTGSIGAITGPTSTFSLKLALILPELFSAWHVYVPLSFTFTSTIRSESTLVTYRSPASTTPFLYHVYLATGLALALHLITTSCPLTASVSAGFTCHTGLCITST
ncbi:hypothetical protein BpHYR1_036049 [Brachionus plicatilis]|uniref:Uncharacterized protein n=1 Tax=Brachionus plicatilis TaxID=10195 RepID=A0A3M7RYV3_BRAPC|nr:hypothetical protein BpHYR1_036049 [Brachionus plicatilis]